MHNKVIKSLIIGTALLVAPAVTFAQPYLQPDPAQISGIQTDGGCALQVYGRATTALSCYKNDYLPTDFTASTYLVPYGSQGSACNNVANASQAMVIDAFATSDARTINCYGYAGGRNAQVNVAHKPAYNETTPGVGTVYVEWPIVVQLYSSNQF